MIQNVRVLVRSMGILATLPFSHAAAAQEPTTMVSVPMAPATEEPTGTPVATPATAPGEPATAPPTEARAPTAVPEASTPSLPAPVAAPPVAEASVYTEQIPVWLAGNAGETPFVEVYPAWAKRGTVAPLAACNLPCGFRVQRGVYNIYVHESAHTLGGSRRVDIDGPARLVVTARHRAKRSGGLVLGIGGIAMTLAGLAVIAAASDLSPANCDVYGRCQTDATVAASGGLALMLVGAAVTPIGWVLFGKSFRPAIDVQHVQRGGEPAVHIGFIGFPGGAGVSGTLAF